MEFKQPKAILLAETQIDLDGFKQLRREIGAPEWKTDADTGSEVLVEIAGRMCYKSFGAGLNPNINRVREGNAPYLKNILKVDHGSVLEHACVTFAFLDVTRVFTHEMVRHRVGTAFSQESLRYVRLDHLGAYLPEVFRDDEVEGWMRRVFNVLEDEQVELADHFGLNDEKSFNRKKQVTSAMRRLAPIGLCTNIVVTANHRAWRHIIGQRCTAHAEEEIRTVMFDVACQLRNKFSNLYQDMVFSDSVDGYQTAEFKFGDEE